MKYADLVELREHPLIRAIAFFLIVGVASAQDFEPLEPLEPPMIQSIPRAIEPMEPLTAPSAPSPAAPVGSRSRFTPGMEVWVVATSLGLRSGPGTEAPLIHYVPEHDRLTVLTDTKASVEEIIAGRPGWWIYVQHGARRGYIFDAYVEAAPATALGDSEDLTCVPGKSVGPITRYTSYTDLEAAFGRSNLSESEFDFGGGNAERVTLIFAGTDKELMLRWEIYKQTPLSVRVTGPRWKTVAGIAVGTPASTLDEINGRSFAFYGLGWQFGGQVTSWEGGALESDHALGDRIAVVLGPLQPYLESDYRSLEGTTEFTSDHPMASRVNLRVESMTIMLNP